MHTKVKDQFIDQEYITITDESISVGKQKLLLQLAVPADRTGKPLSHSDVDIVGMSVSPSWTGDSVKAEMEKTSKSIGRKPLYSISDNGYNLCNACRDAGIPHHRDISHTFGTILNKYFSASADFKEFTTAMEKKRLTYQLTDKAIVLPPKQRAIAGFMNTFIWVKWAHKLLGGYDRLTDEQKEAARFMLDNKDLIEELNSIRKCMEYVEMRCKNDGLSKELARFLIWRITVDLITPKDGTKRMRNVGIDMFVYLQEECKLLQPETEVHIISSDIIESCYRILLRSIQGDEVSGQTMRGDQTRTGPTVDSKLHFGRV